MEGRGGGPNVNPSLTHLYTPFILSFLQIDVIPLIRIIFKKIIHIFSIISLLIFA